MEDVFFIDKQGHEDGEKDENVINWSEEEEDPEEFLDGVKLDLPDELPESFTNQTKSSKSKTNLNLNDTYLITSYTKENKKKEGISEVDKLLKKSVIVPGLEKQHAVSSIKSKHAIKLEKKKLREMTKGKEWFDIPATEVTSEVKTDFELLKMRSVLDNKHFYKKNDITRVPKYFQVGRVIESPADFYGGRIPKSQRKKTIVDELLADAQFKAFQKKKYKEIMDVNRRTKRSKKVSNNEKHKKKSKSKRN